MSGYKKKEGWSRVCKICEKCFLTSRAHQKTCSEECRKIYIKWYAENVTKKKDGAYQNFLKMRFDLLQRDDFRCQYCGRTPQDKAVLIMEHIRPVSKGGLTTPENLITSCEECNAGKYDALLEARHEQKFKTLAKGYHEYNQRFEKKWKDQMAYIERNRGKLADC